MASAFYTDPTEGRRTALTSYYHSLQSIPAGGPITPTGIDAATYRVLLSRVEQLRPNSFLRPPPTNQSDFEAAVATRSIVEKLPEDDVDGRKKEMHDPMEISSALHSALDDIQQILSAGPSSSHDHTHLDEQALGEITAFLQSGPPVVWPENDAVRLTNNAGIVPQNFAVMSNAGPPISVGSIGQRSVKPDEGKSPYEWRGESTTMPVDGATSAVVSLKRYQCVLCLKALDVPASTRHDNGSCDVCRGDVLEVSIYRCRRCTASYYSESAAHHHALFLCTRDDAGDELGNVLRHYRCTVCQVAFFSSASLKSHNACMHGTLQSAGVDVSVAASTACKPESVTDNNPSQSEIGPQQSDTVESTLAQAHSPFSVSSATGNASSPAEEASASCKVGPLSETGAVDAAVSQTKPRGRRRYSGRPPKGIIYKNVFMTSEGLYYCSTCNADLNTVERRAEHRGRPCGRASAASYARHYVFICPHCTSRWSSQKACYEHQIATCLPQIGVNVADLSLRRYACPICSRLHFSLAPLRGHMTTAHRLHRDDVIQRLIAAGYMTPEGANVKFDNVIGIQEASMVKTSKSTSSSSSSTITEAEVIALLNKELNAAVSEREFGANNQVTADRKFAADAAENAKKSDSASSRLSVLTGFPQLPKPVLNLRAIPKIMATSSGAVMSSSVQLQSAGPHTGVSFATMAGTNSGVSDRFCNGEAELESAVSKSTALSNGDVDHVSLSTASVCSSTLHELSTCVKDEITNTGDASVHELKCEAAKNGDVSPACEVTSTAASSECHTTSSVATEMEKQSNGCSDEAPLRNGKLKYIFSQSDAVGKTGQQIQLPVVALERTTLTEIAPTVSLSASSYQASKLRPRQHASTHFSSPNMVSTRRSFSRQRIANLRKSAGVSNNWKPSGPVLRIPVTRPRKHVSRHFSCKHSLVHGSRLVDHKLQKKRSLDTKELAYDCFRRQRAVTKSRHGRRQFTAISSSTDTDAISTRSQCRQMLKHSVVR